MAWKVAMGVWGSLSIDCLLWAEWVVVVLGRGHYHAASLYVLYREQQSWCVLMESLPALQISALKLT